MNTRSFSAAPPDRPEFTAIPVPIAASRKLALPIFSSMLLAPNSATLENILSCSFASYLRDFATTLHLTRARDGTPVRVLGPHRHYY